MSAAAPQGAAGRQCSRGYRRPGALGVLLLGATAALVGVSAAGGFGAPPPSVPIPRVEVPAGAYTAVCPGPPRPLGDTALSGDPASGNSAGEDPAFSPVSSTAKTVAGTMVLSDPRGARPAGTLVPLGAGVPVPVPAERSGTSGPASAGPPAGSSGDVATNRTAAVARNGAVDAPTVFRADPLWGNAPIAGATFTHTADDGDLRGLGALSCRTPSNDMVLLGGATEVGDSSVLVLTNPTDIPAVVDLGLFGADGPVEAAGTGGHLVPPGESRNVVLAGLAGNQEHLAVRVRSDGGRISAVIQQSVLRGLTPGGVELLAPAAPPALDQVIPGVVLQNADTARAVREQDGYAAASPVLQVLVPGSTDAVLDIRVLGPDGEVPLPDGGVMTAAAGSVSTVPLEDLAEGSYTVAITSDVPVAAAARVSRGSAGGPVDFGSAPAAERLGSEHAVVLADGVDVQLVFGAPEDSAEVSLTPVGADGAIGDPRVVGIAGTTSVTVPASSFGPGAVAVIVGAAGGPVFGAQVATLGGDTAGISVSAISEDPGGRRSIPVELRY
ncbi:DUF5719 family protein [Arthrobacter sp. H41]|uniref:DUF5719 family protein n=1 Tax=Arthrobacter sp. H41 TaxID=1312978 RepID=UPI0004ADA1B2|nr:DUF5719 family protein [Arthrobacter sp. H41]